MSFKWDLAKVNNDGMAEKVVDTRHLACLKSNISPFAGFSLLSPFTAINFLWFEKGSHLLQFGPYKISPKLF